MAGSQLGRVLEGWEGCSHSLVGDRGYKGGMLIERPGWQNIDGLDREKTERRVLPVKQETV